MTNIKDYISIDTEVLGGEPVFRNTRVPVNSLFMHLEQGVSLNDFLSDFPSVSKDQAVAVLGIAEKIITSRDLEKFYEAAA